MEPIKHSWKYIDRPSIARWGHCQSVCQVLRRTPRSGWQCRWWCWWWWRCWERSWTRRWTLGRRGRARTAGPVAAPGRGTARTPLSGRTPAHNTRFTTTVIAWQKTIASAALRFNKYVSVQDFRTSQNFQTTSKFGQSLKVLTRHF